MGETPSTNQEGFVRPPRASRQEVEEVYRSYNGLLMGLSFYQCLRFGDLYKHAGIHLSAATRDRWSLMADFIATELDPMDSYVDYMVGLAQATGLSPDDARVIHAEPGTDEQLLAEMVAFCDHIYALG